MSTEPDSQGKSCPSCGHHNAERARFCGRCGRSLLAQDPGATLVGNAPLVPPAGAERADEVPVENGREGEGTLVLSAEELADARAAAADPIGPPPAEAMGKAAAGPLPVLSDWSPPADDEAEPPTKKDKGKKDKGKKEKNKAKRELPALPSEAGTSNPGSRWPWVTIIRIGVVLLAALILILVQLFNGQAPPAPSPTATPPAARATAAPPAGPAPYVPTAESGTRRP